MRKIIINERQEKMLLRLNEAAREEFSLETLSELQSYARKMKYCQQMLGNHIGKGSSRIVFQIDDEWVLKLAFNEKGVAQNEEEYSQCSNDSYDLLPKVSQMATDGSWLIAEYVLPAKAADFKYCLGVSFQEYQQFVRTVYSCYSRQKLWNLMDDDRYNELYEGNEFFSNLYYYMTDYKCPYGDLVALRNLGLANRESDSTIVILDSGLTDEIYDNYYKRF